MPRKLPAAGPTSTTLVVRRRFARERDDTDTSRPLDRCLAWIAEHDADMDYLVLSHETRDTLREYEAVGDDELRRWAATPNTARHAHEVLAWPTKLYGDVDVKGDAIDATRESERFARALSALCCAAEQRFDVVCERPFVLDASTATKFSRHFTIVMRDVASNAERRFATPVDCGNFVRSVAAAAAAGNEAADSPLSILDMAVYRRNNTLRTYGSTKIAEPTRCFVRLGADVTTPPSTLKYAALVRSLVTWPRVRDDAALLHVASAAAAAAAAAAADEPQHSGSASNSRKRSLAASRSSSSASLSSSFADADDTIDDLLADIPAIADAGVTGVKRSDDTGCLLVSSTSRQCALKRGAHSSNTIFFVVDDRRRRFKQLCHSFKCANSDAQWTSYGTASAAKRAHTPDISPPPPLPPQQQQPPMPPPRTAVETTVYPDDVCDDFLALMGGGGDSDPE